MVESNGTGGNGAPQQEPPAADAGAERGVDEGQDVYVSGGNSDNGKLSCAVAGYDIMMVTVAG